MHKGQTKRKTATEKTTRNNAYCIQYSYCIAQYIETSYYQTSYYQKVVSLSTRLSFGLFSLRAGSLSSTLDSGVDLLGAYLGFFQCSRLILRETSTPFRRLFSFFHLLLWAYLWPTDCIAISEFAAIAVI